MSHAGRPSPIHDRDPKQSSRDIFSFRSKREKRKKYLTDAATPEPGGGSSAAVFVFYFSSCRAQLSSEPDTVF
jgi:hypothetical protein